MNRTGGNILQLGTHTTFFNWGATWGYDFLDGDGVIFQSMHNVSKKQNLSYNLRLKTKGYTATVFLFLELNFSIVPPVCQGPQYQHFDHSLHLVGSLDS